MDQDPLRLGARAGATLALVGLLVATADLVGQAQSSGTFVPVTDAMLQDPAVSARASPRRNTRSPVFDTPYRRPNASSPGVPLSRAGAHRR